MLKSIIRSAVSAKNQSNLKNALIPATISIQSSNYASKTPKKKSVNPKQAQKSKKKNEINTKSDDNFVSDEVSISVEEESRSRHLAEDINNKALDVGPNGRPLFTKTQTLSQLDRKDVCSYMSFDMEALNATLPEGIPSGMAKEFEESKRTALLIRQSFLDLRDNYRRIVDPPLQSSGDRKPRKQILLDGPVSSGKSIALAMLVHWAREEGWLVFYVPEGKSWTHGGFFYKNEQTDLWDTPLQATNILQDFLKYNESRLQQLPCHIYDAIPLGEGAGVGKRRGVDSMAIPEGSTLYDLIQTGISHTHAAVGVLVRLREELSLVKDVPVLFAIDQYNSWYTFSEFEEAVTARSTSPIHANKIATVSVYRPMTHNDMMVGAFSNSTAVGKLRRDLPNVPTNARVDFPRYGLDEAATVCHYYLRQRLIMREAFSEEKWKKIYYLANGNGSEMRWLAPLIR
ncbi:hypothetical protein MKX03_020427 [Papaver bracteatum]|nr:hypothetical protein MKX03_020427 [Papaver bracteatum]